MHWKPAVNDAQFTLKRFSSTVGRQSAKSGVPEPAARIAQKIQAVPSPTEPKGRPGSFFRFLRTAVTEWVLLAVTVLSVGAYSAATLALPAAFGELMDFVSSGEFPVGTSRKILALSILAGLSNASRLCFIGIAGERLICSLRRRVYRGLMHQPAAFFDSSENRTGALVQRLSGDCNVAGTALTESLTNGSKNILQTIGSLGVMLYYSPLLTGVILALIPLVSLFVGYYGRRVRRSQTTMQEKMAEMSTISEERLSGIRTVKSFGAEGVETRLYDRVTLAVFEISKKMVTMNGIYVGCLHFVGYQTVYLMLWAGSVLINSKDITAGVLFSFVLYMIYCGMGLVGVAQLATDLNKGYAASLRLFDIIDQHETMEAKGKAEPTIIPPEVDVTSSSEEWRIAFQNVHFTYPTRPECSVFQGINFDVEPSKCTCVVGGSGSGKSTIALLLLKLYAANHGCVSINGCNVEGLDTNWIRNAVGYVGQEPVLFGGTIAQNICYSSDEWDSPIDQEKFCAVMEAAMKANAHDFVTSLPQGYDTYVGERGLSLSGGQKQRIAIARALYRNPRLLILDEATSALDCECEAVVQDAIEKLILDVAPISTQRSKQSAAKSCETQSQSTSDNTVSTGARCSRRTVLMFAHKLSMIQKADVILLLHQGVVVDKGPFEVISKSPMFRQIVGLRHWQKLKVSQQ